MAGPLETIAITAPPARQADYQGPLGAFGWALAWLDYSIYTIEYIFVVVAMVAMTMVEFIYIASLYATELRITLAQRADPALNTPFPWSAVVLLGFVTLMMAAVVHATRLGRASEDELRPVPVRIGLTFALTAAVVGFIGLTVWLEHSSSFYLLLTVLIMVPSTAFFYQTGQQTKFVVMIGLSVVALWLAWTVPDGYSWADKRALFLLLWVGFLGASMAAKQQRHLKIDIARKLCPEAWLPRFNGLSYLVASLFTAVMVYLGYIYLFHPDYGRFWVETIEGEIPDWLKVASIPLALLLITLRFGARGLALLIWGEAAMPAAPVGVPSDGLGDGGGGGGGAYDDSGDEESSTDSKAVGASQEEASESPSSEGDTETMSGSKTKASKKGSKKNKRKKKR
ncbi:MAG: TRAP transporter small permease subunit [Myxococcota bacterium]